MSDIQPQTSYQDDETHPEKRRKIEPWKFIGLIGLGLVLIFISTWFAWLKPFLQKPITDPLNLPSISTEMLPTDTPELVKTEEPTPTEFATPTLTPEPVCGEDAVWQLLLVGIDERKDTYLYGLADVIRVARVDFTSMTVNMVALPRDMVVNAPDGLFEQENPIKINQGYFLGAPGMTGSTDTGSGASALASVIQHNFDITVDHYAVVNFTAVEDFIDAIGGIEVDLPEPIYDPDPTLGYFPAGKQTLDGNRTLDLTRIRTNYSDGFRVGNQTIVLKAVLKKFLIPENIVKVPDLISEFKDAFLTDLSIEQIATIGTCFLRNFEFDDFKSQQIPEELLLQDFEYIPTLLGSSFVFRWDQRTVDWIHQNLLSQ